MLAAKEQAWLSHSSHDIFFEVENMTIISKAYKYVYIYIHIYVYTYIYVYATASWSGFGSCLCMLEILFLIECSMCWDG